MDVLGFGSWAVMPAEEGGVAIEESCAWRSADVSIGSEAGPECSDAAAS